MPEAEPGLGRPSWARRLLAVAVLGGPTAVAFFSGGYFDEARLVAGVVTWLVLAGVALVAGLRRPRAAGGRLVLAGLALLTVVTLVSIAWAPLSARALDDGQRVLLYLGFFLVACTALWPRVLVRWGEPALAGGAALVVGYGLAGRLLPSLIGSSEGYRAGGRLDQPLTYWNALGAVAALGLVLCARVVGDHRRARGARIAAGAAAGLLGAGLYLTYSRGAILFVVVGLLALVAFLPRRSTLVAAGLVALGGTLGALSVAFLPTVADPLDGTSASQGAIALALLVLVALVGGLGAARMARLAPGGERRFVARLALAAIAATLTTIVVLLLAGVSGVGTERVRVPTGPRAERLRSVDSERYDYWLVARDAFADQPLVGTGTSGFGPEWLRGRPRDSLVVNDVHSLYVETAAELGLLGLAGLAALVVGVVLCGRRALARDRELAAGAAAVLLAWGLHAGLDWDWEMPAVTMPALILVAVLLFAAEPDVGIEARGAGAGA